MGTPSEGSPLPLRVILAIELGLALLALLLALAFGLTPWQDVSLNGPALFVGLAATLPMIGSFLLLERANWAFLDELERLVERVLVPMFRDMPGWGLLLVALSAGICEELLFRGVIQAGLESVAGGVVGLVVASLAFGLAHALNRAYFLVATLAGAYLGLLYLLTDSLLIPMIVHFLYDGFALHYYLRRHPRHPADDWDRLDA